MIYILVLICMREKKKLASAGKQTTDLSLDNPSQRPLHYRDITLFRSRPRILHMTEDYTQGSQKVYKLQLTINN